MEVKFLTDGAELVIDLKTESSIDLLALRHFKEKGGLLRLLGSDYPVGAVTSGKQEKPAELKVEKPVAASEEKGDPENGFYDDRELLKAKLDELGIEYNNRLRLPALQEVYDNAMNGGSKKQEEKIEEPAPAPVKEQEEDDPLSFLNDDDSGEAKVTIEDVRESLIALTKAKGPQVAKAVLEKFGAKKVSDLDEGKYPDLVKLAERGL